MKRIVKFGVSISVSFALLVCGVPALAMKHYQQNSHILMQKTEPKVVDNDSNTYLSHSGNYSTTGDYYTQSLSDPIASNFGSPNVSFTNLLNFPNYSNSNQIKDLNNVQSLAVTPDGETAYVVAKENSGTDQGRIVKYNLDDLENQFHVNQPGSVQLIRRAFQRHYSYSNLVTNDQKSLTASQNNLGNAIRVKAQKKAAYNLAKKWYKKIRRRGSYRKRKKTLKAQQKALSKYKSACAAAKRAGTNVKKANSALNQDNNNLNAYPYNQIYNDCTVGPQFTVGHGQELAYRPDGTLWFMSYVSDDQNNPAAGTKPFLEQINPSTLKPQSQLTLNIDTDYQSLGHSFTFDNQGNAWFWVYNGTGNDNQKKQVDFYKADADDFKADKVEFKKQPVSLRYCPGSFQQAVGFNPNDMRLFLASDNSLISVPVAKIEDGSLTKEELYNWQFDGNREFEGLSFDKAGNAFLLSNRYPEILNSPDLQNN